MDDAVNHFYEKEHRLFKLLNFFGMLSIFITCIGLYALSVFYTRNKEKEIGIRKVNGATVREIVKMLSMHFLRWVLLAFVVACPVAYFLMNRWLQEFAYKTALSWWIFVLAGASVLVLALCTTSWKSYKAATLNPVDTLKDE